MHCTKKIEKKTKKNKASQLCYFRCSLDESFVRSLLLDEIIAHA